MNLIYHLCLWELLIGLFLVLDFEYNSFIFMKKVIFNDIDKDTGYHDFQDDESPLKDGDIEKHSIEIMESHNINSLTNNKYFRKLKFLGQPAHD